MSERALSPPNKALYKYTKRRIQAYRSRRLLVASTKLRDKAPYICIYTITITTTTTTRNLLSFVSVVELVSIKIHYMQISSADIQRIHRSGKKDSQWSGEAGDDDGVASVECTATVAPPNGKVSSLTFIVKYNICF